MTKQVTVIIHSDSEEPIVQTVEGETWILTGRKVQPCGIPESVVKELEKNGFVVETLETVGS